MPPFRLGLAQMNPTVGDLEGNVRAIVAMIERARRLGCRLVAFPELAIPGYPPEDLLFKSAFIEANLARAGRRDRAPRRASPPSSASSTGATTSSTPPRCCTTAPCAGVYHKHYLPNYGVFDENRYFQAGTEIARVHAGRRHLRRQHLRGHLVSRPGPRPSRRWPAPSW